MKWTLLRTLKPSFRIFFLFGVVVFLAGCATQPPTPDTMSPGFIFGFFHGVATPFSFIMSWFSDVRLYAYPNAGIIYDAGYLAGLTLWSGIVWR
jgi:hypothetical protein